MKEELAAKLQKEIAEPSNLFGESLLEDIRMFLVLNDWSDEVLAALLKKTDVLRELARALHNDDIFSALLEHHLRRLTLEYAV